jgi:hypothetical protein
MLTKTGLSDTVEPSSLPENFNREGGFEIRGHRAKLEPRNHFKAQPRQPAQPQTNKRQRLVPANSPAVIGDLFDPFDFHKKLKDND